ERIGEARGKGRVRRVDGRLQQKTSRRVLDGHEVTARGGDAPGEDLDALAATGGAILADALIAGESVSALDSACAALVVVRGQRGAGPVAHRPPHRADARAGDAGVAAGARRATGAAVVGVGLDGDAGVAAADRAGDALHLARRQTAGEER